MTEWKGEVEKRREEYEGGEVGKERKEDGAWRKRVMARMEGGAQREEEVNWKGKEDERDENDRREFAHVLLSLLGPVFVRGPVKVTDYLTLLKISST